MKGLWVLARDYKGTFLKDAQTNSIAAATTTTATTSPSTAASTTLPKKSIVLFVLAFVESCATAKILTIYTPCFGGLGPGVRQ